MTSGATSVKRREWWLTFCYVSSFLRDWRALDYTDDDLRDLEIALCTQPEKGVLIQGTGGLRKLRWARSGGGKSGGSRIGYAYFRAYGKILVVAIFAKNDAANFTAAQKNNIRKILEDFARKQYGVVQ